MQFPKAEDGKVIASTKEEMITLIAGNVDKTGPHLDDGEFRRLQEVALQMLDKL